MRFERTDSFRADHRRLSTSEKLLVRAAVIEFASACDAFREDGTPFPAGLRVRAVRGAPGIFEMTWSFAGPDGRATWEWVEVEIVDGNGNGDVSTVPAVRWRRIGSHRIFTSP